MIGRKKGERRVGLMRHEPPGIVVDMGLASTVPADATRAPSKPPTGFPNLSGVQTKLPRTTGKQRARYKRQKPQIGWPRDLPRLY